MNTRRDNVQNSQMFENVCRILNIVAPCTSRVTERFDINSRAIEIKKYFYSQPEILLASTLQQQQQQQQQQNKQCSLFWSRPFFVFTELKRKLQVSS